MFKRFTAILIATLALSACDRVDPDSPLGKRKAIFKDMLQTSENLGGMLRGRVTFDGDKFADGALKLDALAHEPWQHFPSIRDEGESSARPDVWQRQTRFNDLAQQLEQMTGVLVAQTRKQPLDASRLKAPMDTVEAACKACHQEFRNH